MNILTVENVTKSYGVRKLLENANFYLQDNDKVGIIGINGTGKSTLLKMIAGLEEPDKGSIIRANNVVVRYLPQNPMFEPEDSVLEAVLRNNCNSENQIVVEAEAKTMLTKLGVMDFAQKCKELSGGQKKRLALVLVLLSPAEVLILDEPTNHLDHEMADWLETVLKKRRGVLIMVTHDRYFLDSVSNRIVEIDKGSIYSYEANYSGFLELKMQREDMEEASQRKKKTLLRSELEWVQRGARARSTKQKARLERFDELTKSVGIAKEETIQISTAVSRLGKTTVELEHISKAYGDNVLIDDFSYIFLKNDRIGFIGKNGCGKSTLMRILAGMEQADSGAVIMGQTVKLGFFQQEIGSEIMDPAQRVIDYIRATAEYVETAEGKFTASRMLERFLFAGEEQYGLLGKLSGGEKRRLYLLKVLMSSPNILILDEPTNDLDIATLRILEDYLEGFQGIVIVVSHDRYFLDRVVNRIFAFEEQGKLVQYEGGYTDYHNRVEENMSLYEAGKKVDNKNSSKNENDTTQGTSNKNNWKAGQVKKLKFTYQEQKDFECIEEEIAQLENKLLEIEEKIAINAKDFIKLNQLMEEKEKNEALLEEKMDRWMYLDELAAKIEAEKS